MRRVVSRQGILSLLTALALAVSFAGGSASAHTTSSQSATNGHPICSKIDKSIWASQGLRMWCFPPQLNGSAKIASASAFGSNVDAADPNEDITPTGIRAPGQSETSVAGIGPYVVEAWNDATGFFSPCPSPMNKQEGTGFGFSANGGASFVDEGGLPNANCNEHHLSGDPSVVAWSSGGSAYFYISSLYYPVFSSSGPPSDVRSFIAINACKASGTGGAASISCSQPIIAAASTECMTQEGFTFCSFLDKEYMELDPQRGRLYVSFTEFGINPPPDRAAFGEIELAACDIGNPNGGAGTLGGTAATPVCTPGSSGTQTRPGSPYLTIASGSTCANQGSYPAVDVATGDVYVAYEYNLVTNIYVPGCDVRPIQNVVTRVPASCLTLPAPTCAGPVARNAVNVVSMIFTPIPGYNRFLLIGDFPRIAVSDPAGTVSIVWNDSAEHALGDILLQSFTLGGLAPVQHGPVRLNSHANGGLHLLPGLRNADQNGNLNVSWYERSSPTTTLTDLFAALNVDPRTTSTPGSNTRVTTVATDWLRVSSIIVPDFGDYTDTYIIATANPPFVGQKLYVAWSDGRIGIPQPFEARMDVH